MAYGTHDKALAERRAQECRQREPDNSYCVQAHSWTNTRLLDTGRREPLTWGVMQYVPYTRGLLVCRGFMWIF
jgi:hypothetical protein